MKEILSNEEIVLLIQQGHTEYIEVLLPPARSRKKKKYNPVYDTTYTT